MDKGSVVVMGSYVADLAFRTEKLPAWGETCMGTGFQLGPGGKGSNQAVAAARAGAHVSFISKLGRDAFGDLARKTYREEGIETTGAGDAFAGCFAVALAEGKDIVQAAHFACAGAGISVTRPGTTPSMPFRQEMDALLKRPI